MLAKADISLLLDYYGSFLTERRRELMRMSADEDMSLSEIAQVAGVSRQSVRDSINKGAAELMLYEQQLGMIRRDRQLASARELLSAALSGPDSGLRAGAEEALARLRGITD